jgi:hypothetical protein
MLDSLSTQFLSGCDHQWKAFRSSLLDARFHTMRTARVHDQRYEWHPCKWCADRPQGIQAADLLYAHALKGGGLAHSQAGQVVDDSEDAQFLSAVKR